MWSPSAETLAIAPDVVVDASGPFQAYGDPYRVVRACIARRASYLDLADGSEFVAGIGTFDAEYRMISGGVVPGGMVRRRVWLIAVTSALAASMSASG